jgi:ketol-acid reductoisomerase
LSLKIYRDEDVTTRMLDDKLIAVLGYGNQGRAQALNLRDSGFDVIIGNRRDSFTTDAGNDGFKVFSIREATEKADVVMMLIPDEVQPQVFKVDIAKYLHRGDAMIFASGFNIAFGLIKPSEFLDIVMVAPRMIGEGVRGNFLRRSGYPSFVGVAQDYTKHAKQLSLEIAKGIGSTKMGALEVTFRQEAELDLFSEQCFGPAFGQILTAAMMLLVEEGYPAPAVLLELYMSGELSYVFQKAAEVGFTGQMGLHSLTSQYGSLTRALRFSDLVPEVRKKLKEGLEEIRSGTFAREWMKEQESGYPTLQEARELLENNPIRKLEKETLKILRKGDYSSK